MILKHFSQSVSLPSSNYMCVGSVLPFRTPAYLPVNTSRLCHPSPCTEDNLSIIDYRDDFGNCMSGTCLDTNHRVSNFPRGIFSLQLPLIVWEFINKNQCSGSGISILRLIKSDSRCFSHFCLVVSLQSMKRIIMINFLDLTTCNDAPSRSDLHNSCLGDTENTTQIKIFPIENSDVFGFI